MSLSVVFVKFLVYFFSFIYFVNAVNVKILFEALCPDSRNFIVNQLHPSWNEIKEHVDIEFVPFGKAMSLQDGDVFVCQHGRDECHKNKIMSCALNKIANKTTQVEYIKCTMDVFLSRRISRYQKNEASQQCIINAGLQWNDINDCVTSEQGKLLQLEAEKKTMEVNPSFIPTIVYNDIFNQTVQDESLNDFKKTTCSFIANNCL